MLYENVRSRYNFLEISGVGVDPIALLTDRNGFAKGARMHFVRFSVLHLLLITFERNPHDARVHFGVALDAFTRFRKIIHHHHAFCVRRR